MSYDSVVLAETSLVSYWKLDETTGTVAADAKGSNAGTYSGGYTLGQASGYALGGTAVALNGSTGYVTVPHAAALSPTAALSVECWVKPGASTAGLWSRVVAKPASGSVASPYNDYALCTNAGTGAWAEGEVTVNGVNRAVTGATTLAVGTWYHLVLTYDGTTLKLYVNGSSEASLVSTGSAAANTQPLQIGRLIGGNFFNGAVDDVAVYNAALSASAVLAHYTAGTTAAPAGRFRRVGLDGGTNTLTGGTC